MHRSPPDNVRERERENKEVTEIKQEEKATGSGMDEVVEEWLG